MAWLKDSIFLLSVDQVGNYMAFWTQTPKSKPILPLLLLVQTPAKGQLISEWNFGVFKSAKKPTKFLTDFCPSFIGQKSVKDLVGFLGDLEKPKIHSEINWPLGEQDTIENVS